MFNLPTADVEAQLATFNAKLKQHIETQNPTATVGEVLGLQTIKIIPARPLAAGLPYKRIVTSQQFAEVPDKLRHKFKYVLSNQTSGLAGNTILFIEEPTAKLAGKSMTLSYSPASKADEDIINARLPAPDENGQIDPAQLPNSLPGYLIQLTADFHLDKQPIAQGLAGAMGTELHEELGVYSPQNGWETSDNNPEVGAVAVVTEVVMVVIFGSCEVGFAALHVEGDFFKGRVFL